MLIKFKRSEHKDPELELVARLIDRKESEGTVSSVVPSEGVLSDEPVLTHMENGWICSFMEEDGKFKGLAYKEINGKEFNMDKLPWCPTRKEAAKMLYNIVRAR